MLSVHAPWKAFGAEALRHGSVPAFNPTWGLGQPFRGNPNALPLYPGNILYLVLPFWIAFNLHYALHWLLALFAFRALARSLGMEEMAAAVATVTYAGSGYVLSCLSFYNLIAVVAWWPLAMWGALAVGRRGVALGGLACGMAIYAGEPLTVALAASPLLIAAVERHGWRRGLAAGAAIGAVGLLVALPQVVAAARVADFTYRGAHGALASEAVTYSLHPLRWLDLVLPLPFGSPARAARAVSRPRCRGYPLLFFSLYLGCVGLWLATLAGGRRRAWWLLAAGGWLLAWLLGLSGDLLVRSTAGLFRFPEKLLIWPAIAVPLLAGWGLHALLPGDARRGRGADPRRVDARPRQAVACRRGRAPGGGDRLTSRRPFDERPCRAGDGSCRSRRRCWPGDGPRAAAATRGRSPGSSSGRCCSSGRSPPRRRSPRWRTSLWSGLRPSHRRPRSSTRRSCIRAGTNEASRLTTDPPGRSESSNAANNWLHGSEYREGTPIPWRPISRVCTTCSPASSPSRSATRRGPSARAGSRWWAPTCWWRPSPLEASKLVLSAINKSYGARSFFFRVVEPSPRSVLARGAHGGEEPARRVRACRAFRARNASRRRAAAARAPAGGRVEVLAMAPDRIELEVESGGGVAVIRRAFQPLMRARIEGREIATVPVNLCQLGVLVPAGKHRVVVAVSSRPEIAAGGGSGGGRALIAARVLSRSASEAVGVGGVAVVSASSVAVVVAIDAVGRVRRPRSRGG